MRVLPITCYRPKPSAAADFVALPYDVFDTASARTYVAEHPSSFLGIDRAETAFGPEQDPYAPEVYQKAGSLIRSRALDGTLLKDQAPCLYLYRLSQDGHEQMGVVGAVSVAEYEQGIVCRHEKTCPQKTQDRVEHILATGAQTGPVFLTYRDSPAIDAIVAAAQAASPLYDFTDEYGCRQTIWRIARTVAVEALSLTFSTISRAYIADGHHRASAAAQVAHMMRDKAGNPEQELPSDFFLAVLFPASQLSVMAYNRVVHDTFGLDEAQLLAALESAGFAVGAPQHQPIEPHTPRTFGLYAFGAWRELRYQGAAPSASDDPAGALDVSLLQDKVLAPLLGIEDPRTSDRITFVGGIEGGSGLERRAGTHGLAFSLCPTSVDDLMAVSDAGMLMPPKSTWFEPKLRSGFFIRRIE